MNSKNNPFLLTYIINGGHSITTRSGLSDLFEDLKVSEAMKIDEWFESAEHQYSGIGGVTKFKLNPLTLALEEVTIDERSFF